jgi:hypothetical protein
MSSVKAPSESWDHRIRSCGISGVIEVVEGGVQEASSDELSDIATFRIFRHLYRSANAMSMIHIHTTNFKVITLWRVTP